MPRSLGFSVTSGGTRRPRARSRVSCKLEVGKADNYTRKRGEPPPSTRPGTHTVARREAAASLDARKKRAPWRIRECAARSLALMWRNARASVGRGVFVSSGYAFLRSDFAATKCGARKPDRLDLKKCRCCFGDRN
ncbi:hypothetical protein MRX96_043037 [Rhipicephalus microplus]